MRPAADALRASPYGMWLTAAVLGSAGLVLRGTQLDTQVFHMLNQLGPQLAAPASSFSVLGLGAAFFIAAAAAGPRRATATAAVILALLVCGTIVQLIKFAVADPRPLAVLGPQAMQVVGAALQGRAMPSGHAAAGACAAAMCWAAAGADRRLLLPAATLAVVALLEGGARVVVGAHWPSDVLAGAGLGVFSGAIVYGTRRGRRACERVAGWLCGRVAARVLAALLVLVSISLWRTRGDYPLALWVYGALAVLGLAAALRWGILDSAASTQRPGADAARRNMIGAP